MAFPIKLALKDGKAVDAKKTEEKPEKKKPKKKQKWRSPVRQPLPKELTPAQLDLITGSMDIAEDQFEFCIVEVIRITREFPDREEFCLPCDHHRYDHDGNKSCFWCPDCGLMVETKRHDWGELEGSDKYEAHRSRLEALVADFFKKPIAAKF